jgi:hypothetical protein
LNNGESVKKSEGFTDINRVIALWGFTEAALGGILHALRFPFTGLFIGSIAVTFITFIDYLADSKRAVLRATMIVILVKAMVNPYAQLTAYFAVALQGLMGYVFFSFLKPRRAAALLLGLFSLLFSALQKLIFLTVVFGTAFWKSIDQFVTFVLSQFALFQNPGKLSFSYLIIAVYTGIHVIAGLVVGYKAVDFPEWFEKRAANFRAINSILKDENGLFNKNSKSGRKIWWKRKTGIIFILFITALTVISFLYPEPGKNMLYDIFFMTVRSILIIVLWIAIISPMILKYFKRFVDINKSKHAEEVEKITSLFPEFRRRVNFCWKESSSAKGPERFGNFLADSLVLLLLTGNGKK